MISNFLVPVVCSELHQDPVIKYPKDLENNETEIREFYALKYKKRCAMSKDFISFTRTVLLRISHNLRRFPFR